MNVAAIVLAAGKSQRMGRNKLLLKLGSKMLIDIILDALEASKVNEIMVVLGHRPWEIEGVIKPRLDRVRVVLNERYEDGLISSLKAGLRQVTLADAIFVVLGDRPILDPLFLNSMIEQMERSCGKALIVSPFHKGQRGYPLLVSRELFGDIMGLKEREGSGDLIRRNVDRLLAIEAPDWTITDIDCMEDYESVLNKIPDSNLQ